MTRKQAERIIQRKPFQPFRLVLADGEEVLVRRPKAHVSGDQIALVGVCRRGNGPAQERFRLIQVDHVVSAQSIAAN